MKSLYSRLIFTTTIAYFLSCITLFAGDIEVVRSSRKAASAFAIVVDKATNSAAHDGLKKYSEMLENEGLAVHRLITDNATPEEIRRELHHLLSLKPAIEGAILVGDIPIAMIRNAQHLTTAFKMDEEKFDFAQSSVPSDRFYDDPRLRFHFISQDEKDPNKYYFRLDEVGAQSLAPAFYTARVYVPKTMRGDAYKLIDEYFHKVVEVRSRPSKVNRMVTFAGHGYNSDCLVAWADERRMYLESFPQLAQRNEGLLSFNFRTTHDMKKVLLHELMKGHADIMIFNEHGSNDTQYLTTNLAINDRKTALNLFQASLFDKLRTVRSQTPEAVDSVQAAMQKEYKLLPDFFAEAFDPRRITADSLRLAGYDLTTADMGHDFAPTPTLVVLDACYNGDFSDSDYVAAHYLFSPGSTITVQANSRNVLQDRWTNRAFGLLNHGLSTGEHNRLIASLEGHLFGDPTLYFRPSDNSKRISLPQTKLQRRKWMWSKHGDLIATAIRLQSEAGETSPETLLSTLKSSPFVAVRMEAFRALTHSDDPKVRVQALEIALSDGHEMVVRHAALQVKKWGDPVLLPIVAKVYIENNYMYRVAFQLSSALNAFAPKAVEEALLAQAEQSYPGDIDLRNKLTVEAKKVKEFSEYILDPLRDPTASLKKRISAARTIRNYPIHYDIATLTRLISDPQTPAELTLNLVEALGWFDDSYRKGEIINFCNQELGRNFHNEKVSNELHQTIRRLDSKF